MVSEKSLRPNSLVPMLCSSWRTRWLTALGVTHNSSAASVTLRSLASASKVKRHWIGGMRVDMADTVHFRQCWSNLMGTRAGAVARAQRYFDEGGFLVLVGPSTQKQQVPTVPADTLVIHGEADDIVPLSATLDWARPQALPVVVVPGAGHFFHGQLPLLKSLVVRGWSH